MLASPNVEEIAVLRVNFADMAGSTSTRATWRTTASGIYTIQSITLDYAITGGVNPAVRLFYGGTTAGTTFTPANNLTNSIALTAGSSAYNSTQTSLVSSISGPFAIAMNASSGTTPTAGFAVLSVCMTRSLQ